MAFQKVGKSAYKKRATTTRKPSTGYPKRKSAYTGVKKRTYKKKSYGGVNPMVNSIVRGVGKMIGNAIVPGVGGMLGDAGANLAHHGVKYVTGVGDYSVNGNTLLTDSVPQFGGKGRTTRVKHREYIGDVVSAAVANTFKIETYEINPAVSATFPWLSSVAANYEEYRIHGMIFEFKTMSADALNSTNTALGQVIMATQYNPLAQDFANKQQMENYEFGVSTKPSNSVIHAVECQPSETPVPQLYCRISNVSGSDLRLYDFGKFSIATNGLQGTNVNLGELWVSYDIELYKPRLNQVGFMVMDHIRAVAAEVGTAHYFGETPVATSYSNFNCVFGANYVTIPETFTGNVFLSYICIGALAAPLVAPTFTPSGGASALNIFIGNTASQVNNGGTSTVITSNAAFQIVKGGTIVLSGATFPATVTSADFYIMGVPSPMN